MTTQHPTQPGWGTQPPTPPPPQPKPFYRKVWFWALIGALTFFAGCTAITLGAIGAGINEAADPTDATVKRPAAATSAPTPTVAIEETESFDTPALADFKLQVKELSRQRFGSAGDLVEYRVQLVQVRDRSYDPDKEYELSYKITGGEDGPETQTMLIRGDEYEQYEGNASTRSGVKIRATPTAIEEI
jgi:hypothetical protein